jgi:hypothetical protein
MRVQALGARHEDGRRIFRTQEIALLAQQNTARLYGVHSGIVRIGAGFGMLYDPLASM